MRQALLWEIVTKQDKCKSSALVRVLAKGRPKNICFHFRIKSFGIRQAVRTINRMDFHQFDNITYPSLKVPENNSLYHSETLRHTLTRTAGKFVFLLIEVISQSIFQLQFRYNQAIQLAIFSFSKISTSSSWQ